LKTFPIKVPEWKEAAGMVKKWLAEFDRDRLLQDSVLLMAASLLAGASNFVFQAVMGRILSTEEFGIMWSLLSAALLFSVPALAVQMTIARFAAGELGAATDWLFRRGIRRITLGGLPCAMALMVLAPVLADFFQIPSAWPVRFCVLYMLLSLYLPVLYGIAQGRQFFLLCALAMIGGAGLRLLAGAGLAAGFPNASAALAASVISTGLMIGLFVVGLRREIGNRRGHEEPCRRAMIYRYFHCALLGTGLIAVMMNADLLLVKRLFDPATAGLYSRAGTVARLVCYITGPLLVCVFPKAVREHREGSTDQPLFMRALGLSLLLTLGAAAFCSLFPRIPGRLLFGTVTDELASLIRFAVWMFAPVPLLTVLVQFVMARQQFRLLRQLWFGPVAWLAAVVLWHPSVYHVLALLGAAALIQLVWLARALRAERSVPFGQ